MFQRHTFLLRVVLAEYFHKEYEHLLSVVGYRVGENHLCIRQVCSKLECNIWSSEKPIIENL